MAYEIIDATTELIERMIRRAEPVDTAWDKTTVMTYAHSATERLQAAEENITRMMSMVRSIMHTARPAYAYRFQRSFLSAYDSIRGELESAYYSVSDMPVPGDAPVIAARTTVDMKISILSNEDFLANNKARINRLGNTLFIETERIVISDVDLGPFEIHVSPRDVSGYFTAKAFALDPNPAIGMPSITHPNVRHDNICLGEGERAYKKAIVQGRLCDALMIAASVVREYGWQNPHCSIEKWHGIDCQFCGQRNLPNDTSQCSRCDRQGCAECTHTDNARMCLPCNEHLLTNPPDRCYICDRLSHNKCPHCENNTCSRHWNDSWCRTCHENLHSTCPGCGGRTLTESFSDACAECDDSVSEIGRAHV